MATWLDGVIAALIAVVFLSWGLHIVSSLKSTPESGLALQWTFVVAIAVMGLVRGTPWAALGLAPSLSLPFWIVFAILAVSLYPLVRWRARLLAKEENLEKIRHMANGHGPGRLFPKCRWELALFYAMSVSSGTTEEISHLVFSPLACALAERLALNHYFRAGPPLPGMERRAAGGCDGSDICAALFVYRFAGHFSSASHID